MDKTENIEQVVTENNNIQEEHESKPTIEEKTISEENTKKSQSIFKRFLKRKDK